MKTCQHTQHQSFTKEQNQLTLKVEVLSTSSSLSVPLLPTDSHLLDQVRFAALSRRAQERVVAIILRNFFPSIRPSRLCIMTARFINSPLAVYSFIISRTIATAYIITTEFIWPKYLHSEAVSGVEPSVHSSPPYSAQSPGRQSVPYENLQQMSTVPYIRRGNRCFLFGCLVIWASSTMRLPTGQPKKPFLMVSSQPCPR
jgi:hypothetical protein